MDSIVGVRDDWLNPNSLTHWVGDLKRFLEEQPHSPTAYNDNDDWYENYNDAMISRWRSWGDYLRNSLIAFDDDHWYDNDNDALISRWRSWGGYSRRPLPSRPSSLSTPGSSLQALDEDFIFYARIVLLNDWGISTYQSRNSFLILMIQQWWNIMAVLDGIVLMNFTSRAIVIFFMQCGFAFLEAGSVRWANSHAHHWSHHGLAHHRSHPCHAQQSSPKSSQSKSSSSYVVNSTRCTRNWFERNVKHPPRWKKGRGTLVGQRKLPQKAA